MTYAPLQLDEMIDLQVTLHALRGFLAVLHARQMPDPEVERVRRYFPLMQRCHGLMQANGRDLDCEFRTTLDAIRGARDVVDMTVEDFGKVASHSPKWLQSDRLSGDWNILISTMRQETLKA